MNIADFYISGINLLCHFYCVGLPKLQTMIIGRGSFKEVASISIKSVQKPFCTMFRSCIVLFYSVGFRSILGKDVDTRSLNIQSESKHYFNIDIPYLQSITSAGSSFYNPRAITL